MPERRGGKNTFMKNQILTQINGIPIKRNFIEKLPFNPRLKERAKGLRKAGNFPEVAFWKRVHKGLFWKIDFDRQRIIGNYIVDFYVKTLGLIVEIDGSSHNEKEEYDADIEDYFASLGLKVFRTTDFMVLNDLENVMLELEAFVVCEYSFDRLMD